MLQVQYYIHSILHSKSKYLINLFILILLYLSFYGSNLAMCMNDSLTNSSSSTDPTILRLLEKNKSLTDNCSLVIQHNTELRKIITNLQLDKAQMMEHYEERLKFEMFQTNSCLKSMEKLKSNQNALVEHAHIAKQELEIAHQKIEQLTSENLDLRLTIADQKRTFEQFQSSSNSRSAEDLDASLLRLAEDVLIKKRRK